MASSTFELWQVDGGFRHEDWYERPSERPGQVVMALDLDRTQRPWIQWPGGL